MADAAAIGYAVGPMQLDVYQTDGEAFDATAERVAGALGTGRVTVALAGGRSGRGVMAALAARADVPWDRIEWLWGDERCVPPDDPRSNVRLARETLLRPRAIPETRIHAPAIIPDDPPGAAAAYAATFDSVVGPGRAVDVLLLGVGTNGHTASLMPGCDALRSDLSIAAVPVEQVSEDPRVARITVGPAVLRAARKVIVTVTGDAKAEIVARVLRSAPDPDRLPAQLVLPGPRVDWIVDRAAAAILLRDARRAPDQPQ